MQEQFTVGKTVLNVTCNVYYLPDHLLHEAQVAVKLATIGVDGIRCQMKSITHALEDHFGEFGSGQNQVDDPVSRLKWIGRRLSEESLAEIIELLHSWDRIMAELMDRPNDAPCPPLKRFLRDGFFNPHTLEYKGRIYPAGCYILSELDSRGQARSVVAKMLHSSSLHTRLHELAHAAMAVNREKGSVVGCRWMEEAFAEYLMGSKLGFNQCRPSRCELDVYLVWQYLMTLDTLRVEVLLNRWLSAQPLCAFCADVQRMRESVG